jgi:hypothetical protein
MKHTHAVAFGLNLVFLGIAVYLVTVDTAMSEWEVHLRYSHLKRVEVITRKRAEELDRRTDGFSVAFWLVEPAMDAQWRDATCLFVVAGINCGYFAISIMRKRAGRQLKKSD